MALPWARLADFLGRRSVLLQLIALGFLAGLVLARLGVVTHWHYVAAAVVLSVVVTLRKSRIAWFVLLVAALQLGILRGQAVLASFAGLTEHIGEDVVMVGRLEDDTTAARQYQTEFHISDIHILQNGEPEAVDGRVVVRGFAEATLQRGDVVRVEGKLSQSLGNNQAQISYAEIKLIGEDRTILGRARNAFFAGNRTALPEPQASLGMGFLVGLRALLPETLLNNLSATGLTHIVAASGYNLTVLVRLTRRLLAKHSKFIATATAVGLIVGFMAATGISPSIFRAAVVSGLSLAAWYWGRPITAWMVLLFSAAVTAGANPTYIWQDIGWYLSFAAFFGVLIIAPTITARLYRERQPGALTQLLIETFCAQIMALPIIMLIFDELSLLALPANMIILPFIPLAMLLTFVAALAGVFAPQIVGWFAWPADWVLTTMLYIIDWLAGVPWASIQLSLSPWQLVGVYGAIGIWPTVMRLRVRGTMDTYKTVID
jgi:competence protein ComEC